MSEVASKHRRAERRHDPREYPADRARADHPDRLAMHVEAEQAIEREIAFARAVVRAMQFAIEREDHADRMLGNRIR